MNKKAEVNRITRYVKEVADRNDLGANDRISFYLEAIIGLQVEIVRLYEQAEQEDDGHHG